MYKNFFKRGLDIFVSIIGLIVLSPVFIIVTIILFFQNQGKPFFFQSRPGKHGKEFYIIKFKTMTDEKNKSGELLPAYERTTGVGKFIRKLSIDELPQLLNVLKGDMSLIGPRPLLFKYMELYSIEQRRRHELRPGISGWAQVNGRNRISWTEKFRYDIEYIEKVSFSVDMKIMWMTFLKVIKREGINQSEEIPMPPFNGSN